MSSIGNVHILRYGTPGEPLRVISVMANKDEARTELADLIHSRIANLYNSQQNSGRFFIESICDDMVFYIKDDGDASFIELWIAETWPLEVLDPK